MGFWDCVCGVKNIMDIPFCPHCGKTPPSDEAPPEEAASADEAPAAPAPEDSGIPEETEPDAPDDSGGQAGDEASDTEPQVTTGRKSGSAKSKP